MARPLDTVKCIEMSHTCCTTDSLFALFMCSLKLQTFGKCSDSYLMCAGIQLCIGACSRVFTFAKGHQRKCSVTIIEGPRKDSNIRHAASPDHTWQVGRNRE